MQSSPLRRLSRNSQYHQPFSYGNVPLFPVYFVHAYDDDDNEDRNSAFNADVFMTDAFFMEILQSLQTRTQKASKYETTLRNRWLINKYINNFCGLYHYQKIMIPGNSSNLEAYIAR